MYNTEKLIVTPRPVLADPEGLVTYYHPVVLYDRIVCVQTGEDDGLVHPDDAPRFAVASVVEVTLPVRDSVAAAVLHILEVLDN